MAQFNVTPVDATFRVQMGENTAAAAASATDAAQSAAYAGGFETPEYATQSAGNAATTPGQIFRVPLGTSPQTFNWFRRLSSGSEAVSPLATSGALAAPGGAALVGNGQTTVADALPVTVEEFGAVGDGVADDTAAFVAALADSNHVQATPGKVYVVGDVVIGGVKTLDMRNALAIRRPGADRVFWLQGFQPRLVNFDVLASLSTSNSWASALTTAGASAGANAVTVASATGFKAGMRFCIQSSAPGDFEPGEILSIAGNVLTLRKPLVGNVASGARIMADFPLVKASGAFMRRARIDHGVIRNCLFGLESGDPVVVDGNTFHGCQGLRVTDYMGAGVVFSGNAAGMNMQEFICSGGMVSLANYTGNGATTTYAYAWRFSRKCHRGYDDCSIRVRVNDVQLTASTQYTVDDVAGTVTLATPPANGATVQVENFEFACIGIYGDRLSGSGASALEEVSGGLCIDTVHGIYLDNVDLGFFYNVRTDTNTHSGLYARNCTGISFRGCDFLFAAFPVNLAANNTGVILDFNATLRGDGSELVVTPNKRSLTIAAPNTQVAVQTWRGAKSANIAATADVAFDIGEPLRGRSIGTVAAGATVFLSESGAQAIENDGEWRATSNGYLLGLSAYPTSAPGAGRTYTYTARVFGADSALAVTASGDSDFGGTQYVSAPIFVQRGQTVSVRLVTSAGAAAARHQIAMLWVPV